MKIGYSMLNKCRVLVQNIPWRREVGFLLLMEKPGQGGQPKESYVTHMEFQEVEPGGLLPATDATFRLDLRDAQDLMDELWKCGLRPSEGTGSAGAMQAVETHLEDMRTIVSKKLGVQFFQKGRR